MTTSSHERVWQALTDDRDIASQAAGRNRTTAGPGSPEVSGQGDELSAAAADFMTALSRPRRKVATDEGVGRCLPTPSPEMVRAARAYLTPDLAVGTDLAGNAVERSTSDLDAIDAVIGAEARAGRPVGDRPLPMEVAAALVVLSVAQPGMGQTEARLLGAARASPLGWDQIGAILDLSVEEVEERYRRLSSRLDEPLAEVPAAPSRHCRAISLNGEADRA